jgi:acyl-coenzyme A thioesterase PaaI-like protein
VVLGAAEVTFLKPVAVQEAVVAEARVSDKKGKKQTVQVVVQRSNETVFKGVFTCFVLEKHVLG